MAHGFGPFLNQFNRIIEKHVKCEVGPDKKIFRLGFIFAKAIGLLINFNVLHLKEGVTRKVN